MNRIFEIKNVKIDFKISSTEINELFDEAIVLFDELVKLDTELSRLVLTEDLPECKKQCFNSINHLGVVMDKINALKKNEKLNVEEMTEEELDLTEDDPF